MKQTPWKQLMKTMKKKPLYSDVESDRVRKIKHAAVAVDTLILKVLGFDNINTNGVQQSCPVHGGDRPDAFCYNTNKNIWSCFSHRCHEKHGNDIVGLVMGMKDIPFLEAINWLEDIINQEKLDIASLSARAEHNTSSTPDPNKTIDEDKLLNLSKNLDSIKDRPFSLDTAKFFNAGLCDTGQDYDRRIMVPIRNADGEIVGFTGRSDFSKCSSCNQYHREGFNCPTHGYPKWKIYPRTFKKHLELYNIDKAKEFIFKTNAVVVVEGAFDVWRLWELGVKNCVACLGVNLNKHQLKILKDFGCINLITFFDSDTSGKSASKNVIKKGGDEFKFKDLTGVIDCDPGDITDKQYTEHIKPRLVKWSALPYEQ